MNSQANLGYFPAPTETIEAIAERIYAVPGTSLMDPCAGDGSAIKQLAGLINVPLSRVIACELDLTRSDQLRQNLPTSRLSLCSDFHAAYGAGKVSLLFINPPYDNELGGSVSSEFAFLARAERYLAAGGVLVMLVPVRKLRDVNMRTALWTHFESVEVVRPPEGCDKYGERIVTAVKREKAKPTQSNLPYEFLRAEGTGIEYRTVPGQVFDLEKTSYTDGDLERLLDTESALRSLVGTGYRNIRNVRPPLELGDGHRALLLAAGHLNGKVSREGEKPHVVRGTCRKTEKVIDQSSDGKHQTKVVAEQIELVIRTIDQSGKIKEIVGA